MSGFGQKAVATISFLYCSVPSEMLQGVQQELKQWHASDACLSLRVVESLIRNMAPEPCMRQQGQFEQHVQQLQQQHLQQLQQQAVQIRVQSFKS